MDEAGGLQEYGGSAPERTFLGGTRVTFMYEEGSVEISFVSENRPRKTVFITNIETNPPKTGRRKGYASQAVESFIEWAKSQGYEDIFAQKVTKPEAKAFWQSNGFVRKEPPNHNNLYKYVG